VKFGSNVMVLPLCTTPTFVAGSGPSLTMKPVPVRLTVIFRPGPVGIVAGLARTMSMPGRERLC